MAGESSIQTYVDGVNVKMVPLTEGDNNYCVCKSLARQQRTFISFLVFDSYHNPVK